MTLQEHHKGAGGGPGGAAVGPNLALFSGGCRKTRAEGRGRKGKRGRGGVGTPLGSSRGSRRVLSARGWGEPRCGEGREDQNSGCAFGHYGAVPVQPHTRGGIEPAGGCGEEKEEEEEGATPRAVTTSPMRPGGEGGGCGGSTVRAAPTNPPPTPPPRTAPHRSAPRSAPPRAPLRPAPRSAAPACTEDARVLLGQEGAGGQIPAALPRLAQPSPGAGPRAQRQAGGAAVRGGAVRGVRFELMQRWAAAGAGAEERDEDGVLLPR